MKKRFFSRLTALVLTALMLVGVLPIAVWADASDFSYYISTNADGEYAVIDGYYGDGGTVVVPAEIDGLPVLQIAYGVFGSNTEITHVTFSEGILHLSGNIFSRSSVKTVSLPSTLMTISSQCFIFSDLTEITIPESVTLLGGGLFEGCESLTDVYFEAKAPREDWDESWADNCHANIWYGGVLRSECVEDDQFLYRVENKQATVLDYNGDYDVNRVEVPERVGDATVTAIGVDAFKDRYGLSEIILPETVTVIANNAFISCGSLEKVNLPLGLTYIGMQAFMWCGNLQELRIPETVTYIGSYAFYNDYATLYFEASAASDGWEPYWSEYFYGSTVWGACMHRDVTVDEVKKTCETDGYRRVTCNGCGEEVSYEFFALGHEFVYGVCTVCGSAKDTWDDFGYYYGYYYGGDGTETYGIIIGNYYGTEQYVAIPSEIGGVPVIGIGGGAFEGNKTILGVQIPGSVRFIDEWAFANTALRTAELSEGVEKIRACAFQNSKLQMINFPSTLTEIGDCAFVETKLYRINIPASVEYIGNQAFMGCGSLTEIHCEAESQPEGWHEHWDESLTAEEYFADRLAVMYYTENDTVYRIDIPGYDAAEGVATLYDYNGSETAVVIPSAVDVWPVVKIGYNAFWLCNATSVTIPDTVTEIGRSAFSSCANLTGIIIPDSVTAIGSDAFGGCTALTEITIPASVETVGYAAFQSCESLQNIYCAVASQPETWDEHWIYDCQANVYFDGVMFMGTQDGYLFEIADGNVLIKNYSGGETVLTVPSEISGYPVTEIGDNAFTNRYNVTSIVLPDTLRIIRDFAFGDCDSLTEITIPASVEVMGSSVFSDCDNLQNIYCETASQPETWNSDWFGECKANVWFDGVLARGIVDGYQFAVVDGGAVISDYVGGETELVIPDELMGYPVTEIGEYAFAYLYGVTSIVLPDTVTKIGYDAFCYNTSLESIGLSAGLTEIGVRAFEECRMLKNVTIPDGVTYIGEYAFGWCYALPEITIPASVEYVGSWVFNGCKALANIYCEAPEQPEGWSYDWADGCDANIWFDGVLTQGVLDGFRIKTRNGVASILGYVGNETEIIIPAELSGCSVEAIGQQAFAWLHGVTRIVIPDTVDFISCEAFAHCESLTEITIPASVEYMDSRAFYGCYALTDIYCEVSEQPGSWLSDWASGCNASIWFGGVLTQGVFDGFEIRSEDGKVVIRDYVGDATEIVIPSEIGGLPVTVIAEQAFAWLNGVTSITIPDSVENIYYEAFAYNDSLTEITIPASVTFMSGDVFYYCDNLQNIYCEAASEPETWNYDWANGCNASIWFDGVLSVGVIDGFKIRNADGLAEIIDYVGNATEIVIPSELGGMPVTSIGYQAFADLREVTSITIPDTVTFIGNNAFSWCYALTEITIPASVAYMQRDVFWECNSLQNIYCEAESRPDAWNYDWANGCNASIWFGGVLTQGVLDGFKFMTENGAIKILDYFGDASEIVIPSELGGMPVTSIGYQAFADLYEVTSITIPDSVTEIGGYAFAWCYALTEITIPASVKWVEYDVFYECTALQNIYCEAKTQPDGWNNSWTNGCNASVWFGGVLTQGVIGNYRVSFADGGVEILDCIGYENEIVIPSELGGLPVKAIGNNAFADLYEVTSVTIPDSVTEIGGYAFAWNYALTEITIPASVTAMGFDVFWGCANLQNIYCEAASRPDNWKSGWANGCDANIWFDGVLTQGVLDGFKFMTENGAVKILDYVGDASEIVIPSELGGMPVKAIGNNAFADLYEVTSITIPEGVTEIESYAFAWCYALTEITIPASVTVMQPEVFWDCYNLQNIYCEAESCPDDWDSNWANGCGASIWFDGVLTRGTIGDYMIIVEDGAVTILEYIGSASAVEIPSELSGLPVVKIGRYAFSGMDHVTSVIIPDSVVYIGYEAFAYCGGLTELTIPKSVLYMDEDVFWGSYNIQNIYCESAAEPEGWSSGWLNACDANVYFDGVLTRGVSNTFRFVIEEDGAFITGYRQEAAELIIPAEVYGVPVVGISAYAFASRADIVSVELPASLKYIYDNAFAECNSLSKITIPDGVEYIGGYVFVWCSQLAEITIPASVTSLGRRVFYNCEGLKNVYCEVAEQPEMWNPDWLDGCDANIYFDGVLTQGVVGDYKITAEDGEITILEYVGSEAQVRIPAEIGGLPVTTIASQAFSNCDWITDVTVPDSVVYIGYEAFAYCGGLTEMTIPESVLHMDSDVFWNCENLQKIYCEASSKPDGWSFDWASACNAAIYFDGVMARGVIGDYRVEFEDGKATILGYLGIESEPVIPAEIDGRPVVAIGYEAFAYNENLISVTIPASIVRMDSDVFYGCFGLQNIYCESAEEPKDWNYYWTNGCYANVYYDGVLLRGTADGFRFYVDGEGVSITEYFENESEVVIPAELAGLPVVAIESYAFAEGGFTSVVIPDGVVYIGYEAFAYCLNLTEITIPESVLYMESDVFWGCSSMETVYCEASAQPEEWSEGWLNNCRANIYFGGVLTIGTFGDYYADISGDGAVILGYRGEGGEITVPAEIGGKPVVRIGAEAFMGQEITSIVLPVTLRMIGSYAFADTALTEIAVPASVALIGSGAFSGCAALRNIYLAPDADIESWPGNWCLYCEADVYRGETQITFRDGDYRIMLLENGVTILDYLGEGGDLVVPETFAGTPVVAIGRGAFDYLDGLTSVVLPDSIVSIGDHAFNGCYNLQSVVLPKKLESIGYSAFCDCVSLTEIAIPGTVAYIADEAFVYCRNLTKVFLGNGVLDIGYGAFAGCNSLQSIVLPNTLLAISDYAFAETALTEITIPKSVEYIGAAVFAMAKSLAVIYCEAEDIGNWEPFWLEGCDAEVVWGVASCLHETVAKETKAPTCGYDGYLRTVCTDCGTVLEETIFPATGEHEMDMPAVGGPDCEGWSVTYGCKNCDYTETLVVPATGHAYGKDGVCTKCGDSTVELVISVGNASAKPGETFEVEVVLDHNTGFTWLELVPEFDPDVLELISVENGNISNLSSNGEIYVWSSASNATATGKLCTLVFAVREDAAVDKTAVSVSVSMCNSADGSFCAVAVNGGVISTSSFLYGDINGDGKITGMDVTRLLRYIANRNPVTGESTFEISEGSDCNGDGKITGTDVTRLLRYIANRNPITGESSVTLGPSK